MLKTKEEIKRWLDKYGVENYTINENLTVDVDGSVNLAYKNLKSLDVQFGIVTDRFNCAQNNLEFLTGAPEKVGLQFNCNNNKIRSLEGGPKEVGNSYSCSNNNLETLKGSPSKINGSFWCNSNKLFTLMGAPLDVKKHFDCSNNNLEDINNGPINVDGCIYAQNNPIKNIDGLNTKFKDLYLNKMKDLFTIIENKDYDGNLIISYADLKVKELRDELNNKLRTNFKYGNNKVSVKI